MRVDYALNKRNTIMGRYTQDTWTNPSYNGNQYWGDTVFPVVNGNWAQPSKMMIGRWTSTVTNTSNAAPELADGFNDLGAAQVRLQEYGKALASFRRRYLVFDAAHQCLCGLFAHLEAAAEQLSVADT